MPISHVRLALAALGLLAADPVLAHPHVWVTSKAVIDYASGRVTGVRHAWTFDAGYSAFVTQGLDANKDGTLSPEELQGLAAENTANLAEFAYFTKLKVAGKEQPFGEPREPRMHMDGDKLTLSFVLPLKSPVAQGRGVAAMEVYDPTYFVSFNLSDEADAAKLSGAPAGCAINLTRPKPAEASKPESGKAMTEAFFEALTASANYGVQFANRVIVACP